MTEITNQTLVDLVRELAALTLQGRLLGIPPVVSDARRSLKQQILEIAESVDLPDRFIVGYTIVDLGDRRWESVEVETVPRIG